MKRQVCAMIFVVLAMSPPASAQVPGAAPDQPVQATAPARRETDLDRQVRDVASQLRCVVCQGLSIQDSPSSLAQEMRALVREQLAAGRSPDEVKAYFVERYGEWVLLRPAPRGFNLVVYLLPVVMIVGGAAFVFAKARQWTGSGAERLSGSEAERLSG